MTEAQPLQPRWEIILTRQAEKALGRLPKLLFRSIDRAILTLSQNPYPLEAQKLVGPYDNLYRLRVEAWSIAYAVEAEQQIVLVLEIAPKQQPGRYQLEDTDEEDLVETPEDLDQTSEEKSLERLARVDAGVLEKLVSLTETESLDFIKKQFLALNLVRQAGAEAPRPGNAAWYVIYTHPGYEARLKKNLIHRIETMGLQDKILRVVVPGEREAELEDESQQSLPHKKSPGAVLIEMILDDDTWYVVKNTPGVSAFFGSEGKPTPLRSEEVDRLIQYLGSETENLEFSGEPDHQKIRLLLVGDNADTLGKLQHLLADEPGIEVVGIAPNSDEGFVTAIEREPDVVLAEISLPMTPFKQFPAAETPITQICVQDVIGYLTGSTQSRTREFLTQPVSREVLAGGIRRVHRSRDKRSVAAQGRMKLAAYWFRGYKLGEFVEISLSVTDLVESLSFYEKLGLKSVGGGELPYPWAIVSDGRLHLGLHQSTFPSPTLSYFSVLRRVSSQTGTSLRIDILRELGITTSKAQQLGVRFAFGENGHAIAVDFKAPEGQRVFLADMLMQKEAVADKFSIPMRDFLSRADTFGELSLKTENIETAAAYWEQLGFQRLAEDKTPYPWATLSDGLIRLGLHQASCFTRPAVSYFRSDMPERLEQLRQQGVQFISKHKDTQGRSIGALIYSPDGQPILLFTGEIKT